MVDEGRKPKFGDSFDDFVSFVIVRPSELVVLLLDFQNLLAGLYKVKKHIIFKAKSLEYFLTVWQFRKFTLNEKIFRQIISVVCNLFSKHVAFTKFLP